MNKTLLLADDNETARRVVELTFQGEGMRVTSVADGAEAMAIIERETPDIVLADIGMSGHDGYEIASFVKRSPELRHIPVVLLTSEYGPVDHERVRAIGCDGVLTKPLEADVVLSLVRNLCGDAGAADTGVADAGGAHHDFHWPLPSGESGAGPEGAADYPFEVSPAASTASGSIDDYLDRLDEALDQAGRPSAAASRPPIVEAAAGSPGADARPESAGAPTGGPTLAEAFAALLAAERGEPLPASSTSIRPHVLEPSDALVDEITRRVLERLTDRVIREVVSERVLDVADRLVREEIDRIKTSARQP